MILGGGLSWTSTSRGFLTSPAQGLRACLTHFGFSDPDTSLQNPSKHPVDLSHSNPRPSEVARGKGSRLLFAKSGVLPWISVYRFLSPGFSDARALPDSAVTPATDFQARGPPPHAPAVRSALRLLLTHSTLRTRARAPPDPSAVPGATVCRA